MVTGSTLITAERDALAAKVKEQADEIERLRGALAKIAARDLQSIARQAFFSDDAEVWFAALDELKEYDMQAIAIDAIAPNTRVQQKESK